MGRPRLPGGRRTPRLLRALVSIIIVGLAFFFLGRSLYKNWTQIRNYFATLHFRWAILPLPFLLYALSFLIVAVGWKEVLAILGERIRLGRASWIVIYSQFGKYLPGKVWAVLGRVYLARQDGIQERHSAVSMIIETIYLFMTSLVLFALSLFFYRRLPTKAYLLLVLVPLTLVWIYPPWFNAIVNFLLKRIRQKPVEFKPSARQAAKLMLIYLVVWLVQSLGFYFLILSFHSMDWRAVAVLPGAYSLSWILGVVVLVAPGGLGVREGVFALLLGPVIPGALNVVASLLSRIWITLSELLLLGSIFLIERFRRRDGKEPGTG
jgi:uncharacterized membrane protein YbhN (UPF0104 family)